MGYSKRRTAKEWAKLLAAQQTSNQTIKAFCAERQLNTGTFYYWRSKMQESVDRQSGGFINLRPQESKITSGGITLRFVNGMKLELPVDYPPSALSELIRDLGC
jgi:hypothetical protein